MSSKSATAPATAPIIIGINWLLLVWFVECSPVDLGAACQHFPSRHLNEKRHIRIARIVRSAVTTRRRKHSDRIDVHKLTLA